MTGAQIVPGALERRPAGNTRPDGGRRCLIRAVLPMLAIALLYAPVSAQGWIEPLPGRVDPGVVKVRTNVSVRVTDRVALVEVEEWFRNAGQTRFGEGDYLYPLPGEAEFSNFSLFQGDEELRGETMNAEEARRIYEEIVRRKKDPALIELVGHGLVRARVFPIGAGETRKITMRYTQVLKRSGDALQFRYAAGARFAGMAAADRETAQGAQGIAEPAPLSFTLTAHNGEVFGTAFSPTHELRVTRERNRLMVRPTDRLRGDFALFLPFADRPIGITLATHRTNGEDGYFMMTLSPRAVEGSRVPRDVTAVVDVSGSMSGEKMDQARRALLQLLNSLDTNDRFRLIAFSSTVRTYRPDWTQASSGAIDAASEWVDHLHAEGGTNISEALTEAFRLASPEPRLPVVLFLTDGLPSVGERNPERIAEMAGEANQRARIFAFGVGHDVNTYLLDRLGVEGRGGSQYVQPGEDVEAAVSALATRVRHPVLTELRIANTPVRLEDVYPRTLPDLFAGEELILFGRYTGSESGASGPVSIRGTRNGRSERYETRATFAEHEADNDYIPRLWAARKLGVLQQEIRLHGANGELIEEIRELALRYGLLSEYTSYLVQEPGMLLAGGAVRLDALVIEGVTRDAAVRSGAGAVAAAETSRRNREVRSEADLMAAQKAAAPAPTVRQETGEAVQAVGGRVLRRMDGVWTDVLHRGEARIVDIAPYSDAWFALLRRLPELEPIWTRFERALVAGRATSLRLRPDGLTRLTDRDLDRIVREFRAV
ncbi:MAG: VIT domain-containing protein [Longimicrobiales bacterium]